MTYNHLNLPKKIVFDTGEITYLYDATCVKLKKTVTDENTSQISNTHYSAANDSRAGGGIVQGLDRGTESIDSSSFINTSGG